MQLVWSFLSSRAGVALVSSLASVVGVWLAEGQPSLHAAFCGVA